MKGESTNREYLETKLARLYANPEQSAAVKRSTKKTLRRLERLPVLEVVQLGEALKEACKPKAPEA